MTSNYSVVLVLLLLAGSSLLLLGGVKPVAAVSLLAPYWRGEANCSTLASRTGLLNTFNPTGQCIPRVVTQLGGFQTQAYTATCSPTGSFDLWLWDEEDCSRTRSQTSFFSETCTEFSFLEDGPWYSTKTLCDSTLPTYTVVSTAAKGSCTSDKKLPSNKLPRELGAGPIDDCVAYPSTTGLAAAKVSSVSGNTFTMKWYASSRCGYPDEEPDIMEGTFGECFQDPILGYPTIVLPVGEEIPGLPYGPKGFTAAPTTYGGSGGHHISVSISLLIGSIFAAFVAIF